jgi:branched-chain amino acid transport system substrate-binding protein
MKLRFLKGVALPAMLCAAGVVHAEDGVTDKEILIGGSNAVSGPVASVCYAVTRGQLAYFKRVNDAGGVNGRKIRYEVLDDAYSAQRAIGNVRRLTQQDKVFAMFGGCGTITAAAILAALIPTDVPYLFPYAGLDQLTHPTHKNIFALLPLYSEQLKAIVPYALEKYQPKTAAMYSSNIAGHEGWRKAGADVLSAGHVKMSIDALTDVTSLDRAPYVLQAKEANPDMLMIFDAAPNAARFLIEMERQNWKPKVIVGYSTLTDETFLRAGPKNAEGILMAAGVVLPPTAPQAKGCIDDLAAADKSAQPSHFTMFGCASAMVLVEALKRAGPDLTRAKLEVALEGMKDYETGISGKVSFSPTQHMGLHEVYPFGIKDGAYEITGPLIPVKQ